MTSDQVSVWEILDFQGRSVTWLATATGYPRWKVNHFKMGRLPAPADFRALCATLLGVPESRLFFGASRVYAHTLDEKEAARV